MHHPKEFTNVRDRIGKTALVARKCLCLMAINNGTSLALLFGGMKWNRIVFRSVVKGDW